MNTRFNPTLNGPLHAGHLYLVLLNLHAARSTGGQFIVRFDDDQPYWDDFFTRREIEKFGHMVKEDLEWLEIIPDRYTSEREARPCNESFIRESFGLQADFILADRSTPGVRYLTVAKKVDRPYPYTSYLTGVKVAQDYAEGIDLLLRGEDLLTEFSLYSYLCDIAGIRRPEFKYVPRMLQNAVPYGQALSDLAEVCKTNGGYSIRAYRDRGWTPKELIGMVAESALEDPQKGWTWENVKKQPIVRAAP